MWDILIPGGTPASYPVPVWTALQPLQPHHSWTVHGHRQGQGEMSGSPEHPDNHNLKSENPRGAQMLTPYKCLPRPMLSPSLTVASCFLQTYLTSPALSLPWLGTTWPLVRSAGRIPGPAPPGLQDLYTHHGKVDVVKWYRDDSKDGGGRTEAHVFSKKQADIPFLPSQVVLNLMLLLFRSSGTSTRGWEATPRTPMARAVRWWTPLHSRSPGWSLGNTWHSDQGWGGRENNLGDWLSEPLAGGSAPRQVNNKC